MYNKYDEIDKNSLKRLYRSIAEEYSEQVFTTVLRNTIQLLYEEKVSASILRKLSY